MWRWSSRCRGCRDERDLVRLAVRDVERVHPPRVAGGGFAVAGERDGVVAVQLYRMYSAAVVADRHADDVSLLHVQHRNVGEESAGDGPPEPGLPVDEAHAATDPELESAVHVLGVEGTCGWTAVAHQVQLTGRLWLGGQSVPDGPLSVWYRRRRKPGQAT